MRNGLLALLLAFGAIGISSCTPETMDDSNNEPASGSPKFADENFFQVIDAMTPQAATIRSTDPFVVESAIWDSSERVLIVQMWTKNSKGTLLTLTGLPESTMLDTFRVSRNYGARYAINLANDRAVPCQLTISSVAQTELVDISNAPSACNRQIQIAGRLPNPDLAKRRVTVTVDDVVFETRANDRGDFALDIYNDSHDARVSISAGVGRSTVQLFSGRLDELLQNENASASAWAAEILGRRHTRRMLASL